MASPFRVFRKHQKVLIATLGMLAMIAFVFLSGPVLDAIMSRQPQNPVRVSTTAYGDLRASDVDGLMRQRQMLLTIFGQLFAQGDIPPQFAQNAAERIFGPAEEEAVVNTWLMANKAQSLGLSVGDPDVKEFLAMLLDQATQGKVTTNTLVTLLAERKIPQAVFISALQRELLAQRLLQSFQPSTRPAPPLERFRFYRQLNQQAEAELLPFEVEQFIDQIDTPSDATLQAFFEEHRDQQWRPDTPTPGFRQPDKVAMMYFKANYDTFFDPEAISEEDVREQYEQTKDTLYRRSGAAGGGADEDEPTADAPTTDEPTADEPGAEPSSATNEPEEPAGDQQPADGGEAKPSEPSDEADEAPATDAPAESDGSRSGRPTPVRLVALQADDNAESADGDAEQDEAPTDEKPEAPAPAPSEASGDTEMNGDTDTTSPAEDAEPESADDAPMQPSGDQPAEAEQADETAEEPTDQPDPAEPEAPTATSRYQPLEEVEDEIRSFLASRRAAERINDRLITLQARIRRYYDDLAIYEVDSPTNPDLQPPEKLDFSKLAEENNMTLKKTDLVSAWELRVRDIGEARLDTQSFMQQGEPVVQYVFRSQTTNRPEVAIDAQRNRYLFWVTERQEAYTPEWNDEIREQVVDAWKMVEARSLAREAAQKAADQAREQDKPLRAVADVPDRVLSAGPFPWLTYGNVPPSLRRGLPELGEVDGVDFAGDEFMRTAFGLELGQTGVAMNQPETVAYAIRPTNFEPKRDALWDRFLRDDFTKYQGAAVRQQIEMARRWRDEIQTEAGLEWHEVPRMQSLPPR
jgi:hypothetical protein